ncbi:predicted protein [Ostreococcus lucimarinus CCE9901]|jgi:hypothetical protein|uniref:Uncharacterized protein n=2 Tax=Ostreococcus sp. 'lucimarinus' TaxID=242159 RepID=A4RYJ5_OSTLU|nr:predicted protein [Ostreococcus lucimarinus CCE9901]ABO96697.1 predicted protein [Ostreococcus lucimarinus CCE9901]|eukprot:XP_001418404.1 predicted protein [Ostreococcus lucimarinus CCE9901]
MARATACACCARATCATQTLDEIAFDRSACGAAARGDVEALREALARRPASADEDGTTTNASGYTPLHHAARRGCARCVKACLELGCDARATTRAGRGTALHKACAGGRGEACAALLEGGSDAEARDADGENALHKACASGELACVRAVFAHVGMGGRWERMNAARDRRGRAPRDAAATEAIRAFIDERSTAVDERDAALVIHTY